MILIRDYLCLKTIEPGMSKTIMSSQYNIVNQLYFNFKKIIKHSQRIWDKTLRNQEQKLIAPNSWWQTRKEA